MITLLYSEWVKIRSLRSFVAGLVLGALGVLYCNVNAVLAAPGPKRGVYMFGGGGVFTNNAHIVVLYIFGAIGAMVVVSEYGSGLIRTTFAAVPARTEVMAAKYVVVFLVTTVAGLVTYVASFAAAMILAGQSRLPHGLLTNPSYHRAIAASILLFPLSALVGLGIGALLRHTATTVVAVSTLLVLVPTFVTSEKRAWVNSLHNATPFAAWQRLTLGPQFRPWQPGDGRFAPLTVGGSWLVYVLWPLAAVLVGLVAVRWRDV